MENQEMFEVALRNKFRFPFRGVVSTEDLFDLSVEHLDSIFKSLNSQLKQVQEESLLDTKSKEDLELDIKIAIVKHIFAEKKAAREKAANAKEIKVQEQIILETLKEKENEDLRSKSPEELRAMLAALKQEN